MKNLNVNFFIFLANGTFVNEKQIPENEFILLENHSKIRLGDSKKILIIKCKLIKR